MPLPLASRLVRFSVPVLLALGSAACSRAPKVDRPSPATAPAIGMERTDASAPPAVSFERQAAGSSFRLVFHAAPLANLVYQLDCMAGRHPCSRAAFESLWRNDLGWNDEDEAALADWRELRARFQGVEARGPGATPAPPLPLPRTDRAASTRLAVAGLVARTPQEHIAQLGRITSPADARRVQAIADHFRPRFDAYWAREGRALCERSAEELASLFAREDLTAYIERAARFYEANLPEGTVLDFHLMARPPHRSINAAHQLGSHAVVEVLEGEPAKDRAPVVVHELFHHLFAAAPDERLAALQRAFLDSNDPVAIPSHALLDEALATALGTAEVSRKLDPTHYASLFAQPGGLYAEETIDRVAKALEPFVEARLAEGGTLHGPGFVEGYLAAVRAAYPAGLPPIAHVRPLVAALEPAFWGAFEALDGISMASSLGGAAASDRLDAPETMDMLASHRMWGAAFFVTPASLHRLARFTETLGDATLQAAAAEVRRGQPFVYAVQRSPGVYRFVFVAKDTATMGRLVRALSQQKTPFEGSMALVERPAVKP
ncbi:hypothetical protein [Polyangium aurulentum]|uniref:hypothetical protein n=1 Tax=Polyangium aurulentum TaxID=2567896 RepID=UPI0010AE3796|nr:hypothetical protein [Polyangium aurulentum]UQA62767.1 hypothetical protein E8A73_020880 [Polyangium aurulentum]